MKILVLAGGFDQIALIQELKSYGHQVILADYFEHPPAKAYADRHVQISTLDEDAVFQFARQEKVDLITTACTDQALLTMAKVSERLSLPTYISYEKAIQVTNKFYMKQIFQENNIPTARFILLDSEQNWLEKIQGLAFPMVVKPCDCNSSKGVCRVESYEELQEKGIEAFHLSRSRKIVVEEYIEGEEISVDAWVDKEGAKVLSMSGTSKIKNNEHNFTIYQSRYPVSNSKVVNEKIGQIVKQIAQAFELHDCPLLIQALVQNEKVYVIEFSARIGGGSKYKFIEYMSGITIMKTYVQRVLGDIQQVVHPVPSKKVMELDYFYAHNGTVTQITGLDTLHEEKLVEEIFQYKPIGSEIKKHTTSSDRVFGVLLTGECVEDLLEKRRKMMDMVDILDGEKSILYRKCMEE